MLVLYSYWQSSYAWRVRFALKLKGLSYEYKAVNLAKGEQFSPDFERLNPLHYVPALVDGDVVVSDSYAILLFLEEKYPQKALWPDEPRRKALSLQPIQENKQVQDSTQNQEIIFRNVQLLYTSYEDLSSCRCLLVTDNYKSTLKKGKCS